MVRMWIPQRHQGLVKFANKDEIKDYIDAEQLPRYLGGHCTKDFTFAPPECQSVTEVGDQWGFSNEEINDYLKSFGPQIKETKRVFNCDK